MALGMTCRVAMNPCFKAALVALAAARAADDLAVTRVTRAATQQRRQWDDDRLKENAT
jgi:hypothetical protein